MSVRLVRACRYLRSVRRSRRNSNNSIKQAIDKKFELISSAEELESLEAKKAEVFLRKISKTLLDPNQAVTIGSAANRPIGQIG
ncbi:unnamed protein product [Oikopleura dioica]|uniref:Uncharacterized protein n=1 Tax=Oikopleura dioica TaxID=34765 RepID=E4YBC2_OIKDI|nr:unnamed protein product [Oikopleura dioica]